MIIHCDTEFKESNQYQEYFNNYQFSLSDFQKYVIKSIITGNHCLVTAHTGSEKHCQLNLL